MSTKLNGVLAALRISQQEALELQEEVDTLIHYQYLYELAMKRQDELIGENIALKARLIELGIAPPRPTPPPAATEHPPAP